MNIMTLQIRQVDGNFLKYESNILLFNFVLKELEIRMIRLKTLEARINFIDSV